MRSPDIPPGRIGKFRHPTKYFLTLVNETNTPVWIELEWRFPGEDAKQFRTGRIESAKSYQSWRNTFGVVSDKPIGLRIVVFADEARARLLGSEETFFLFTRDERDAFIRASFSQKQNIIMTGWPEMGSLATDVPGTLADAELQTDIQLLLWKEESKQHRDCKHEAVRAEPVPLDSSAIVADMLADSTVTAAARSLVERAREATQPGVVRVERWLLKSCEAETAYEVLLVASPGGGTDVVARPIRHRGP
jgi:hypothetical protein